MQTLEREIIPPKETSAVTLLDKKLAPLLQRRNVLETKMFECISLLNPYTGSPTPSERAVVEARLGVPQAQADLQRIGLDIADLEGARAKALNVEQERVKEEINRQIGDLLVQLRRDFEQYIRPKNTKVHELEELKEKLTERTVSERWADWGLLDETPTSETRWGLWCRSIAENFGV